MTWVRQENEERRRKQDRKYAHSLTNLAHLLCYCLLNDKKKVVINCVKLSNARNR
jgi:hypothetical protein